MRFLSLLLVLCAGVASGVTFEFAGQLGTIELDNGNARYSGVPVGTPFSGSLEFGTANDAISEFPGEYDFLSLSGFITDGTTTTNADAGTFIGIGDNVPLTGSSLAVVNALLGTSLPSGTQVDLTVLDGSSDLPSGNIFDFGILLLSLDTSVINDFDIGNFPLDPGNTDLALFSIAEFDNLDNDIYAASGVISGAGGNGSISGTVALSGQPVTDGGMCYEDINNTASNFGCTGLDGNGSYLFENLAAGDYVLVVSGPTISPTLFGDVIFTGDNTAGTIVTVGPGEAVVGIDFSVTPGFSISGRVTEEVSGNPVANLSVCVYYGTLSLFSGACGGSTDLAGNYQTHGVPAGNDFVVTLSEDPRYVTESWNNRPFMGDHSIGDRITVSAPVTGIDFALALAGGDLNPVPVADIFSVLEGNSLSGNVTNNDNLGDGLGSVSLQTQASNGTLALNADGSFTYNPDGPGTDTFSYSLTDVDGDTAGPARVTITVAPDPNLATIITIDPMGDFAQQVDDAIAMANGGSRVVRIRFPSGTYQYNSAAKAPLATPITGRVVMEPSAGAVTIRGQGPDGGSWLEVSEGSLEIRLLSIENFGSGLGGAVAALDGAALRISSSGFFNNASSGDGGAVYSGSGAQTIIEDSSFTNNSADGAGGAVRAESGSSLTLTATSLVNNTASSGAALSLGDGNAECGGGSCALIADIADVTLEGNTAQNGGAVNVELFTADGNDSIRIEKGVFADNNASGNGCDVVIDDQRSPETTDQIVIADSTFFGDCSASRIEGNLGGFTITDSTIVHDGTAVRGTGTVNLAGTVLTDSSLVGTPGSKADVDKDACETTAGNFVSLGFNISSDDSCGLNQATDLPSTDPMIQRSGKDFTLLAGSPILDSGASELLALFSGEGLQLPCGYKDTEGLGRPQDGDDDGVYECDIGNVEAKNGPDATGATSSAYFDPARPGEGVFVEVLDGGLVFLAMFTYTIDASGPVWLVGVGQSVANTVVVDEMLLTSGGMFGPGFNPDAIVRTPVGGLAMVFRDCSATAKPGRLAFQARLGSPFTDLLVDASRLSTIVSCTQGTPTAFSGRSGSFFDPDRNGEGIFVQWLDDGRVLVIWYTYDGDGNQFWTISGDAQVDGSTVTASMLYPAQGTRFGQDFNPNQVVLEDWGTMTLEYNDCSSLVLSYESSLEGFGTGSYNYQRLTSISGSECDL